MEFGPNVLGFGLPICVIPSSNLASDLGSEPSSDGFYQALGALNGANGRPVDFAILTRSVLSEKASL
jgi:hypothetical protein